MIIIIFSLINFWAFLSHAKTCFSRILTVNISDLYPVSCADAESFFSGGPTLTTFIFLVDEGREDPNTTISGPSSTRQQNAI